MTGFFATRRDDNEILFLSRLTADSKRPIFRRLLISSRFERESVRKPFSSQEAQMRFAIVLLPCLFLNLLLRAQNPRCSGCPAAQSDPTHQSHAVCLSEKELVAHIATRKPIGPPDLNEPHMNSHGTVVACLCFSRTGKVADVSILSGPAMMQQSVLESVKDWTFRPVKQGGRLYDGYGTIRIQVDMVNSKVNTRIEE
jgi:hypothetical protein